MHALNPSSQEAEAAQEADLHEFKSSLDYKARSRRTRMVGYTEKPSQEKPK